MSSVLYAVYCIYMGYTALIYFRFIRILPIFYICYERMKGWLNNKVAQYCSLHVDAFLQSVALQRFGLTLSVSRLICFVVLCTRKSQLLPHWIVYKQAIRTLSFMVLQPAPTRGGGGGGAKFPGLFGQQCLLNKWYAYTVRTQYNSVNDCTKMCADRGILIYTWYSTASISGILWHRCVCYEALL